VLSYAYELFRIYKAGVPISSFILFIQELLFSMKVDDANRILIKHLLWHLMLTIHRD
jgi:hypothetical protein